MATCPRTIDGDLARLQIKSGGVWYDIGGLSSITAPGIERATTTISAFGQGPNFDKGLVVNSRTISGSGYMLKGDTEGQERLLKAVRDKTEFTDDIRLYLDYTTSYFIAPDIFTDGCSQWTFDQYMPQSVDRANVIPLNFRAQVKGYIAYFDINKSGTELAFVQGTGSGDSITSTGSDFVTLGFRQGDIIIIEGSTSNDGYYKIATVAAGTLTLTDDGVLTSEAALAGTYVFSGIGGV